MCERERARPGRAAGTRLGWGVVRCDQERGGAGWYFCGCGCARLQAPGCVYPRVHVEGCARVSELRLRGPACSSACPSGPASGAQVFKCGFVCGGGGGPVHTFPNVRESVRVFTRVDVCAQLSLGEPAFACIPACLWVPVSTCVFLCVLVCTWISMRVSTRTAGDFWGHIFQEQRLTPPNLSHCPATWWGPWGKQGEEMPGPQQQ